MKNTLFALAEVTDKNEYALLQLQDSGAYCTFDSKQYAELFRDKFKKEWPNAVVIELKLQIVTKH